MVKKEEKKKEQEDNSGNGYDGGQYPFVLFNRAVLRHKTTQFRLLVRLQQIAK